MMRYIAPMLVLLSFTNPQGAPVWIERSEVSTVQPAISCDAHAKTQISTLTGPVCVREPLEEVVKILEQQRDSAGGLRSVPSN